MCGKIDEKLREERLKNMGNDEEQLNKVFFTADGEPVKPMQTIRLLKKEEDLKLKTKEGIKSGDVVRVAKLDKGDEGKITVGTHYKVDTVLTDELIGIEVYGLPYYYDGIYNVYTNQVEKVEIPVGDLLAEEVGGKDLTYGELLDALDKVWDVKKEADASNNMGEEPEKGLEEEPEMVNHPAHYEREGRLETINYMEFLFGTKHTAIYCKITSFKYRDRALLKENEQQDYKKCDWYMDKYKELKAKVGTDQEVVNLEEL